MVKKEQGQDDYFSQQSILLTITNLESMRRGNMNLEKPRKRRKHEGKIISACKIKRSITNECLKIHVQVYFMKSTYVCI